jgi:uncharacterized protein
MNKNLLLIPLLLAVSCSSLTSYNSQVKSAYGPYQAGDVDGAAENAIDLVDCYEGDAEEMLFCLEAGSMLRDAGRFEESISYLDSAEGFIKIDFDLRATLDAADIAETVAAYSVSSKALTYKGAISDRVMINTLKALDYIALGNIEDAASEARRIVSAQEKGVALYAEISGEEEQAAREGLKEHNVSSLNTQSFPGYISDSNDRSFNEMFPGLRASTSASYDSPFSSLVMGLIGRVSPGSLGQVNGLFAQLARDCPQNTVIADELAAVNAGNSAEGWGYVIFENGVAPRLESVEIAVPIGFFQVLFSSNPQMGDFFNTAFMSLPTITQGLLSSDGLLVDGSDGLHTQTETVSDISDVMTFEYQQRWDGMLRRELFAFIVKTIAIETAGGALESSMQTDNEDQNAVMSFIMSIFKSAASSALAQADDRSWQSLAKRYEVGRFHLDGQSQITLSLAGHPETSTTIDLPQGKNSVIIQVRSINPQHISAVASGF